jgi:hypothetical protein
MQNANFFNTLGNPRKNQNLKVRYLGPWAKIKKSARLNCLHGLGVLLSAYFVCLAWKFDPPEALGPKASQNIARKLLAKS